MKRRCFTLIELLVVSATIMLIVAILLPSLQNSREHAKAIQCSSNIRQLALGLVMYETENKTFPHGFNQPLPGSPPGGYAGGSAYDRRGWWWFNFIEGFYKKSDTKRTVVCCPSKQLNDPKLKNNILCGNYGVNLSICKSSSGREGYDEFIGTPLSTTDIPRRGETMLIADSGYSIITWRHATDVPPIALGNAIIEDTAYIPGLDINKKRNLWPGQEEDAINGRHPNKTVNVGFVDGHVDKVKAKSLFVEKIADGYKNKNPLWQPK